MTYIALNSELACKLSKEIAFGVTNWALSTVSVNSGNRNWALSTVSVKSGNRNWALSTVRVKSGNGSEQNALQKVSFVVCLTTSSFSKFTQQKIIACKVNNILEEYPMN